MQQCCTVHVEHAADGVFTSVLHEPLVGPKSWPVPIPSHTVPQLWDQHASIARLFIAAAGCFASHAAMQSSTDCEPPEELDVPCGEPVVPLPEVVVPPPPPPLG